MTSLRPHRFFLIGFGLSLLTACASGPDRRSSDRDGPVGAQVIAQPISLYFAGLDSNQDKRVTRAELTAGLDQDWQRFDRPPSAVPFSNWALSAFGSKTARPSFISFDTDLDGTVTEDEFVARLTDAFDRLDQDDDGVLTREELITVMERSRRNQRGDQEERRLSGPPPGQTRR